MSVFRGVICMNTLLRLGDILEDVSSFRHFLKIKDDAFQVSSDYNTPWCVILGRGTILASFNRVFVSNRIEWDPYRWHI